MTNFIVLDTHILVWLVADETQISQKIKEIINAGAEDDNLIISSMSLWEVAMLLSKKKLNIYYPMRNFFDEISKIDGLIIKDINSEIAIESVSLDGDFHGDPSDRIIVATTRVLGATLLTRDEKILKWAKSGNIKTIKV